MTLRNSIRFGVAAGLGAVLVLVLVWFASPARIIAVLRGARPELVALSWCITFLATGFRTWRFGLFVPLAGRFPVAYGVFGMSRLLNLALPFRTGEVAVLALLKRTGLAPSIAGSLPVWAVLRAGDVAAVGAWFSLIVGVSALGSQYELVGWAALGASLGVLLLLYLSPRLLRRGFAPRGWVGGRIAAVIDGLTQIGAFRQHAGSLTLSLLVWAALVLSMVVSQQALNSPLGSMDSAVVAIIALSASVLPINAPLGIGTGDAIWAAVLALFGVPIQEAVAIALGIRVLMLSAVTLDAVAGAWLLRRAGYSLRGLFALQKAAQVAPRK